MAVAGQTTGDLARAVGAKVEVDAHVAVPNRRQRLIALIDNHERHDELVRYLAVIRLSHTLCRVVVAAAFANAVHHCVEGLLLALPTTVAIHGVVAAAHGRDLANTVLAHLLLQLLNVAGAVGGQRVAAVHEGVHEHALHSVLLSHAQDGVEMVLVRVHTTVRQQSEEMQPPLAGAGLRHGFEQGGVLLELPVFEHQVDLGDVHVNDAPGADVQVPDLAVAHLPGGQADVAPAGVNEGVGKLGEQFVIVRLARQRDGIRRRGRSITPAIKDDEDEWFGASRHRQLALGT